MICILSIWLIYIWFYVSLHRLYCYGFFLPALILARRLAGKSVSNMTYLVSSGMLNFYS